MKFLLVVLAVLLLAWLWRSKRPPSRTPSQNQPAHSPPPFEMVACAYCGLHLPQLEAVAGEQSLYCSKEHLHLGEPHAR